MGGKAFEESKTGAEVDGRGQRSGGWLLESSWGGLSQPTAGALRLLPRAQHQSGLSGRRGLRRSQCGGGASLPDVAGGSRRGEGVHLALTVFASLRQFALQIPPFPSGCEAVQRRLVGTG